jgi:diguanylate cyclase (GGDEF)-like protein/PAS domain S-box-containing protein
MLNRPALNQLAMLKSLAFKFTIVGLAYYFSARLGLMGPYKESIVTLLWLPTGIAVGAILRWGYISLPAIFLAATFVELSLNLPVSTSLGMATGNTLAPLLTAHLLKKSRFDHSLAKQHDILLMISLSLLGMLVSSVGGVLSLYLSDQITPDKILRIWFIWWMGDTVGVLLALPLVLNISKSKFITNVPQSLRLFAWILFFATCEYLIVNLVSDLNKQFLLTAFLILPVLIWASMAFGIVGGSIVVISLCTIAVWFTAQGYGTFYSVDVGEGLFSLWTFMVTLVVTMLLISTLQSGRNAAEKISRENERKLRSVVDGALDAILTIDDAGRLVEFNPAAERMFGYQREQVLGRALSQIIIPPRFRKAHDEGHKRFALTNEKHIFNQRIELIAMRSDGTEFPVELTLTALNEDGLSLVTGFIRDISEQKKARQEIENFAYYDVLTGLPNRRLLVDRFQHAVLLSQRTNNYCALMFIDLDNFKILNDSKGHDIGDQLLMEVAKRIQLTLRAGDTVARLSGDEFIVILESLSSNVSQAYQQASEVAQKLLEKLNASYHLGLFEFNTSASLGITLFKDDHINSFETHLRHADAAMYQAKANGRNTYRFYDEFMQEGLDKRFALESALSTAVKNGELHLNYQSIVDVDQNVIGAEVLLRWGHQQLGEIHPAEFIPIAENNNEIIKIGHWVLQQACEQLKAWETHPLLGKIRLSVNISAKQFLYINFINELREIIAATDIDPDLLKLELTETAVIDNIDNVISKMKVLKKMGIGVSLDDFGIGHSSLIYLKKLPVTQIKIDQSFVQDVLTDANDAAIIKMVLAVGKTIRCDIVAEGVEQLAQFELLKKFGCHYFQGFYFSKPLSAANFEQLVVYGQSPVLQHMPQ